MLRLPESLRYILGMRMRIYTVGDRVITSPCEYNYKDKNSEAHNSEKELATRLYTTRMKGRTRRNIITTRTATGACT